MSLLGKVLAGLNILAAIAFGSLVALDWGKRQTWTYAVFRQDLALHGLPVDENQVDPDGTKQVDRITDATMQDMFRSAGGGFSGTITPEEKTQVAEVRRARNRVTSEVEKSNNKVGALVGVLAPLARTNGERQAIRAETDVAKLTTLLNNKFDEVLKKGDPGDKRRAIAHLLVNLESKPEGLQRVVNVIGLEAYAAEADKQAVALREMADDVALNMVKDSDYFVAEHRRVISELQAQTEALLQRQDTLKEQTKIADRHQGLVDDRKNDIKDLNARIDTVRKETQMLLDLLGARQKLLFETQKKVKDTGEQNQDIERKIRQLEKVNP